MNGNSAIATKLHKLFAIFCISRSACCRRYNFLSFVFFYYARKFIETRLSSKKSRRKKPSVLVNFFSKPHNPTNIKDRFKLWLGPVIHIGDEAKKTIGSQINGSN